MTSALLVQRVMPHYRVGPVDAMVRACARRGIDLQVAHGHHVDPALEERGDCVDFPEALALRNIAVGNPSGAHLLWQSPWRPLTRPDIVVLEGAIRTLALPLLLGRRRLLGRPRVVVAGPGPAPDRRGGHGADDVAARLVRASDGFFAYTDAGARWARSRGVPAERVAVLRNTIDTSHATMCRDSLDESHVAALRHALDPAGHGLVVYSGGLVRRKHVEDLLDAARRAAAWGEPFNVVVVGDGPERGAIEAVATRVPGVHVLGPRYGADLALVLATADIMVIPQWAGLAVVDGFVHGLPILTTRDGPHPPEHGYLADDHNAVLVHEPGPTALARAVCDLLADHDRRRRLAAGSRRTAERLDVEQMAETFASALFTWAR